MPIVMISGHGNIETAVAAIKQGAYDFIESRFKADRLLLVAQRALEISRLKREVKAFKQLAPSTLVGNSPSINQLRQTIEKVAPTNSKDFDRWTAGLRQGTHRACYPCQFGSGRGAVCGDQCRRDYTGADGNRTVRY